MTTATPATPTTPTVNGRVIALAHYAGRAVLERVLTRTGNTFNQSVTLRVVAIADAPIARDKVAADVTGSLKIEESAVHTTIDELVAAKLVEEVQPDGSGLRLTPVGRDLYERVTAETNQISARIYADIPTEDLATAGRVLTLVNERANAELARM
ncbi:MarR family winged helix-turn-helix transcriptional regulator [Streptomyces phaeochromogenes]|uniref:MarR family winged helix-turn-helix transcriptional regulator n=1 Tax=Streptomyces phaeochromogenes TaxID=1923 RepID=A0ABZ1H680_STRPH|nr:MarR family winged helix-turn-helix transcriptional regulator [Streptomyces phaeochromogenes]WSD13046.1 MarR family winged helix-turn-helix transcriptional regulator [Streptomyces phaeochromogenes]